MIRFMHKYKKYILIGIILLVVPTFILWGGYRSSNKNNSGQEGPIVVASVGGVPVYRKEYVDALNKEIERRSNYGKAVTFKDLASDGTADKILNGQIDSILLDREVQQQGFSFSQEYLVGRLKQEFKDDKGNFDATKWNEFVTSDNRRNWNEIYDRLGSSVAKEMFLKQVMAPARVLDSEVRKQFEDNHTKLQVKYVAVDPKIEPTQEQIKAEYDKDPTKYQIPEKKSVQFVSFTLAPPKPALVDEVLGKAKAGEDFAELAKKNSKGPDAEKGGEMPFIEEYDNAPANMQTLFKTPVGSVSDAVEVLGTWFIYKVEEEKTDATSGKRSVRAREIMIQGTLDPAERAQREQKAADFAAKAIDAKDLKKAADEAQLAVQTAPDVSTESLTIDNVPGQDARTVKSDVVKLEKGDISNVINGQANLYVAQVTDVVPPQAQPLEAVQEKVKEDATETIRKSKEHMDEVKALGDKILEQAKTLPEILAKFPEMGLEIKETKEFTRKDYLFQQGVYLQTTEIFEAVGTKEPGAFAGPLRGFRGEQYFIELLKKTAPTEDDWANSWPKEEPELKKTALEAKKSEFIMDYLEDLRQRSKSMISMNAEAIANVLSPPEETEDDAPLEAPPAPTATPPTGS